MKLIFNIMSAASFGISLILVGVIIYLNMTKQQRIDENRKYMLEVIEKMVDTRIQQSMPPTTGKVNVGNK
tara:strand:- start:473 stop:682 length:210 start_codon:yes stop_codon:yes gene_type:complete